MMKKQNNLPKRIIMSIVGVLLCAISVGFFKFAALGVDPFQSLMAGLDALIPIRFGTLYIIVNAVLLLFALIFDRHYIGIATFINLFLLGYIAEYSLKLLVFLMPSPHIVIRIASLIIAVIMNCIAASLYITADLGVSTYDAVALIIVNTWKKGKFRYVRIITDIVCILIGIATFLISGGKIIQVPTIVGIGTIITAFFMGPLIEFFNVHLSGKILKQ